MGSLGTDVVIIGGGIAGLSAAVHLSRRDIGRVMLLEGEACLGSHSSGRNAAIWAPVRDDSTTPFLSRRSRRLLDELVGPDWLRKTGGLFVTAEPELLDPLERGSERTGLRTGRLDTADLSRISPAVRGGEGSRGLFVDGAGVMDVHAMVDGLARAARAAGAKLSTGRAVRSVSVRRDRVEGVVLDDGETVAAGAAVLAAGARANELGRAAGAPLPLRPLRRHLFHLGASPSAVGTILWRVGEPEVYCRPESGDVLASPCDEEPGSPPGLPVTSEHAAWELASRLRRFAPGIASADVRTSWACFRTTAPDRELVIGADPRIEGLYWLAGLEGRGMTVGAASGEILAAELLGNLHSLSRIVSPARFVRQPPASGV